ncbi:ricin-type beta-trefoil lectin domain protein [Actinoplanes sp. NPDC049548]|uniref:ricin-type beta-trefoil lectin domain protein n=1 Tax=Actinoplanes sp. NPDC049548 TaxID=3155152 RepID=UPI003430807D
MSLLTKARCRASITAAVIASAGTLTIAAPANADATTVRFRNIASGKCLESFLQSDPQRPGYVYTEPCPPQGVTWRPIPATVQDPTVQDAVQLLDIEAHWCLESNGVDVYTRPCQEGNEMQAWRFGPTGTIEHIAPTGCVTGDDDTSLFVRSTACADSPSQQWTRF